MTYNLIKIVVIAAIMATPLGILGMMNQGVYADSCASSGATTEVGGTASSASGTDVVNAGNFFSQDHEKCGSASAAGALGTRAAGGDDSQCANAAGFVSTRGIACANAD